MTKFNNLDEAADYIIQNMTADSKEFIFNCPKATGHNMFTGTFEYPEVERIDHERGERIFTGTVHHGFGTGIRNGLNLWWTPENAKRYLSWPQEKSKLIEWFENIGLDGSFGVVGDDRGGLLLRAVYRKFHGLDIDVSGYVKYLKDFYSKRS
jgi:hypothetical protein